MTTVTHVHSHAHHRAGTHAAPSAEPRWAAGPLAAAVGIGAAAAIALAYWLVQAIEVLPTVYPL